MTKEKEIWRREKKCLKVKRKGNRRERMLEVRELVKTEKKS